MNKKWYPLLAAALLFISSSSVASADIFTSPNSPTTPQPFTVTCDPYNTPFVEGGAYMPSGTSCDFTIPQTGTFKMIGIYKGTVGNSVAVRREFTNSSPSSSLTETGFDFSGAQPGDLYFAAAFSGSVAEMLAMDTYLQSGGAPFPSDLTTVAWEWGVPTSPLTVTADNKTVAAGSAIPVLTAVLSGFTAPDTASSNDVTGQAACTTTATTASPAGMYPITCTVGSLVSTAHYTFDTFVPGTLTITTPPPPADTAAPVITITSPVKNGIYGKSDTVFLTATVTDASAIATTTYWFNGVKINPAIKLPLTNAPLISKVSVSAKDIYGNTATSTQAFYIVQSTSSCLIDIIQILLAIKQDKTLPDKPTIANLIADCSCFSHGGHRWDLH